MKNNEEEMVIVKINPKNGTACPLLDVSNEMTPVCALDNSVPYCKECRKGFSRAKAVERMAKALHSRSTVISDMEKDWEKLDESWLDSFCKYAETALDALLDKEAEK